jgi:hypothetical protein
MVLLLKEVAHPCDLVVVGALARLLESDPSDQVRALADQTLRFMRQCSLHLWKREMPAESGPPQDWSGSWVVNGQPASTAP